MTCYAMQNSSPEESSASSVPTRNQVCHDEYFAPNSVQTLAVIDVAATRNERSSSPLWLYLVVSTDL